MRKQFRLVTIVCGVFLAATSMAADELMIFPNAAQSADQQEADKFTCYGWAKGQSGFDPMVLPTATAPPPKKKKKKGGAGRGLLKGAAIGGIVGGSSGAKKGAGAGALVGGSKNKQQQKKEADAQAQWEQEQVATYTENRSRYNRAYGACLEGKNYTVR